MDDNYDGPMTVGLMIEILEEYLKDETVTKSTILAVSSDPEGNCYSPMSYSRAIGRLVDGEFYDKEELEDYLEDPDFNGKLINYDNFDLKIAA